MYVPFAFIYIFNLFDDACYTWWLAPKILKGIFKSQQQIKHPIILKYRLDY